jgi:cation transport regulator
LPKHAQKIYQEAHDSALEQYKDPKKRRGDASLEETAPKVAWAPVKKEYEKDEKTGKWKKKPEKQQEVGEIDWQACPAADASAGRNQALPRVFRDAYRPATSTRYW